MACDSLVMSLFLIILLRARLLQSWRFVLFVSNFMKVIAKKCFRIGDRFGEMWRAAVLNSGAANSNHNSPGAWLLLFLPVQNKQIEHEHEFKKTSNGKMYARYWFYTTHIEYKGLYPEKFFRNEKDECFATRLIGFLSKRDKSMTICEITAKS